MISLSRLDHVALTVADTEKTVQFYRRVLGMEALTFGPGRRALAFGSGRINLHQMGREFSPHALWPTPGSVDLCFLTDTPLAEVEAHLRRCGVMIEEGPVSRAGAAGSLQSLYIRDPDGNLVEIANSLDSPASSTPVTEAS